MIRASKSPWASPIVVIVKKNGVDIRLCVDYRLVNGLTQLMVYPMPLVTDHLEDLSGYGQRVLVPMTDRSRLISAFVTPFGLFEWLRMPFGLCNAPRIYQRLIDNALYGFWKLSPTENTRDVFKDGIPSKPGAGSVLGRRSYVDDILILIGGTTWDDLCQKVERLLEVCEEWNLSISVEKSEWGMSKHVSSPETRDLDKWTHAERAFDRLRSKIATTPMLKHFDVEKQPAVIVYASDWAVSAVLAQDHDGVYLPVKFTSRTLKPNELNYSIAEKYCAS
ncbi:LOW QUALITY PROTEIN: reverse transcriptase [Phytophthora megakarya]|uniref:Reverse transcriptase n=1 Tax=Phytophthora megakarya TaxID=4795 RepID=A0A225UFF2_9STRA|nr:LOW QUALITY PROTEIN: reverse transcriptase [Phytophthora megakarya]